ncbi:MAG: Putative nucleoside permease NupX [Holosporales bacterium]
MTLLDFRGFLGIVLIFAIVYVLSQDRAKIQWRNVALGILVQFVLVIAAFFFPPLKWILSFVSDGFVCLKEATLAGSKFVFGYLGGGDVPFTVHGATGTVIFAFQILPLIVVVSALSMVLFHLGILPLFVRMLSPVFQKVLRVGGALGVVASAKLFLSQMETPLLVRPYIARFSRTELLMIMACGMSTTSAAAIPLYSMILGNSFDHVMEHILIASLVSIPASITLSRILIPDDQQKTDGDIVAPYDFKNSIDALSKGAIDGMTILWNIVGMLIVFSAVIFLINAVVLKITGLLLTSPLSLQNIFGFILSPFTYFMGIPWCEAQSAAELLSTKTLLNEVFAFVDLSKTPLSCLSKIIMLYALCGFANFSSVGMVIGSLGTLVPERRDDIVKLAPRALIIGALATCLSGTIMGLAYNFQKIVGSV